MTSTVNRLPRAVFVALMIALSGKAVMTALLGCPSMLLAHAEHDVGHGGQHAHHAEPATTGEQAPAQGGDSCTVCVCCVPGIDGAQWVANEAVSVEVLFQPIKVAAVPTPLHHGRFPITPRSRAPPPAVLI